MTGMTMTAAMPSSFAASATPWAWLPAEAAMTPAIVASRLPLAGEQRVNAVEGAAALEREDALLVLALEQDLVADAR